MRILGTSLNFRRLIPRQPRYQPIRRAVTLILFEDERYGGRKKELDLDSPNPFTDLEDLSNTFPSGVRSIILKENAEKWKVFTQVGYQGTKATLQPGRSYSSLDAMGLANPVFSIRQFITSATMTLYEDEGYGGKTLELQETSPGLPDLAGTFPKGVSSIILKENAKKWQVFTKVGYNGAHVTLQPGRRYSSLDDIGLENPIISLRTFYKAGMSILYENEFYRGKTLELDEESPNSPDLTSTFPKGASSIVLKEDAKKLQVFTKVGYNGAQVTLHPGRRYSSLDAMGLVNPVMSIESPFGDEVYNDKTKNSN